MTCSNLTIHLHAKNRSKLLSFDLFIISLHQRKLDLLKEQKKGFLQKMFV